jgi:hypothetical protein
MDPVTTAIVTALSVGTIAGLTDTAKTAVNDGYNKIKDLLTKKHGASSEVVLAVEKLEAKPQSQGRKEMLQEEIAAVKAEQDEEILAVAKHLLTLVQPQQAGMGKFTIQNNGPVQGQNIGDHQHITQHFHSKTKDGVCSLEKGSKALWDGDYPSAKRELRVAIDEIDGKKQPREAAKANYLFALALLDGRLPRCHGDAVMNIVVDSMNNASRLSPYCSSYYRIFASIKRDFFNYNGLRFRLDEVQLLESKGALYPQSIDDDEIEDYFRRCQPHLPI